MCTLPAWPVHGLSADSLTARLSLFVPNNQIDKVAQETGAVAFDAPGVELGHHAGRCSFEAIACGSGLRFPDDLENLQHQFGVYDALYALYALYAWCRLDVAAK